jgi:hypothetical protein
VDCFNPNATPIQWYTSGTSRMLLDSSGNLGLGVTPSATNGTYFRAYEVGKAGCTLTGATSSLTSNSRLYLSNNAYGTYPSSVAWVYGNNDSAAQYAMESGQHQWLTAASGTAGNTISFTQAMTLDAIGQLLVGATAQNGVNSRIYAKQAADQAFRGISTVSADSKEWIGSFAVLSDGVLNIAQSYLGGAGSYQAISFTTSGSERARITSGGDLLVGTTTAGAGAGFDTRLAVEASSRDPAIFKFTGAAGSGYPVIAWHSAATGDNFLVRFATEASITTRGSITYNRTAGLVAYNTTSDYRAKDILGPVQNSGATIDALKVYEGQMKGATQSRPMLVAHEAQEHAPYAVTGEKDAVNEDGTPKYQQMDVSALVPLLLAEIQSLRARVAQLESK